MPKQRSLSPFRAKYFPIYDNELLGFFLLSACFFLVAFQYAALRGSKDIIIMSIKDGGAAAIAASKVFVILFMILFKIAYDFMCRYVDKYNRFNYVFGYFIAFFSFTAFILYPNRYNWQIAGFATWFKDMFILGKFWPIWLMLRYWTVTIIYIHCECLGSFGLGVCLWGVVSFIFTIGQSKRIYIFFSFFAGMGTLLAGTILKDHIKFPVEDIFKICTVSFVLLLVIYNLFIIVVKKRPDVYVISKQPKKKKIKMSFSKSFTIVAQSRYLTGIALLVLGYSISIVLFEASYRDILKQIVGVDKKLLHIWSGSQIQYIGLGQMIAVFMAPYIMRRKWEFGASLVVKTMFIGTFVFFGLLFFGKSLHIPLDIDINYIILSCGLGVIVIVKIQKYLCFDAAKERLYLVLNGYEKVVSKSAVDGVVSRFGKGFSALFITFFIVPVFGDIKSAKYMIFFSVLFIVIVWLWSVKDVGKRFAKLLKDREKEQNTKSVITSKDK